MKKKKNIKRIHISERLILDSGKTLPEYEIAYETYGKLNKTKSNAIFICHALTGDQFCTLKNPINNKKGWWNSLVGPGKVIDTNFFFVICSNVLGGCMGTTGPESINPETKKPYGLEFPVITNSFRFNEFPTSRHLFLLTKKANFLSKSIFVYRKRQIFIPK